LNPVIEERLPCKNCLIALLRDCLINASLSAFAEWFPLRSNESLLRY